MTGLNYSPRHLLRDCNRSYTPSAAFFPVVIVEEDLVFVNTRVVEPESEPQRSFTTTLSFTGLSLNSQVRNSAISGFQPVHPSRHLSRKHRADRY